MTLVNIGPCWVNPQEVASAHYDYHQTRVLVRMHDGVVHAVDPQYQESVFNALERIVKAINRVGEAGTYLCHDLSELNSNIIALGDQGYRIITVITQGDLHTIVAQKDF